MRTPTQPVRTLPPQEPGRPARGHLPAWQWPLLAIGAVLAVYLVGRGIAELFVVHYGDPASYAGDWGGPSLIGVLAVHTGPAVAIVAVTAWRLLRRRPVRRQRLPDSAR